MASRPDPRLLRRCRPILAVSASILVLSGVVLVIVMGLDAFNATVYSVDGKRIGDDTPEAVALRGQYSGVRAGAIVVLILSAIAAVASLLVMYRGRDRGADGDSLGFEELAG